MVTGPTASGKTGFAIELAERVGGEIVSADSMQVYRHLDIGTAKPTRAERARVPHHLIDVADPDESYNAGRFRDDADRAIAAILARGRVPVVCGGTALYLRVLLHGLAPVPGRDPSVRAGLESAWDAGGRAELWAELCRVDPDRSAQLHPNDRTRVVRALEVWRVTGRRQSDLHRAHGFSGDRYRALCWGLHLPRDELYERIDRRTEAMVSAGWVDEVRRLFSLGYGPDLPPLRAIGYREIVEHLRGRRPWEEVVPRIQRETRRFAKRQLTWLRRADLRWVAPDGAAAAAEQARKFLQRSDLPL